MRSSGSIQWQGMLLVVRMDVVSGTRGPTRAFHAYEISRFPRNFQISM